jgi:pimeloyl-ACP methyl ester carboxylesterase
MTSATTGGTDSSASANPTVTRYHTANVDGVEMFYREAGPADAPVVVLLHGFPASSRMFRNLIPKLADKYHIIAPDYPAFGHSAVPDRTEFTYSFEHLTTVVEALLDRLGVHDYALYVMDFGAPIGFRLAVQHPDRVTALVVQNAPAYAEGLGDFWSPFQAYWDSGSDAHRHALRRILTLESTKSQYLDGVRDISRVDPDNWLVDQTLLVRPGVDEIMLDLFYDIRNDRAQHPGLHDYFRTHRPAMLVVSGANDPIFPAANQRAYLRDLSTAELHLLDTGHFALEDKGDEIAVLMHDFLDRKVPRA